MKNVMFSLNEVASLINKGKKLLLAGDEELLKQLPEGNWIGGSIPYFMTDKGGLSSSNNILINELPDFVKNIKLMSYDKSTIENIYNDGFDNGFSVLIIPAMSDAHLSFALNAPDYNGFATKPIIGWILGTLLDDIGKKTAKSFNGSGKKMSDSNAVVMHVELPVEKYAEINIINIFSQGEADIIEFPESGFQAVFANINGGKQNFAEYITKKNLDIRLPLVADYSGAMINISFQSINKEEKKVNFYAPVFEGIKYKHAAPVSDYIKQFNELIPDEGTQNILFSCNCILNYLYSELENKKTGNITGPITFGEIAYQLLNQTLVYLEIRDL